MKLCGCRITATPLGSAWNFCDTHAAAPELLETLAALTSVCVIVDGGVGFDAHAIKPQEIIRRIEAARAAIAKAKGGK